MASGACGEVEDGRDEPNYHDRHYRPRTAERTLRFAMSPLSSDRRKNEFVARIPVAATADFATQAPYSPASGLQTLQARKPASLAA